MTNYIVGHQKGIKRSFTDSAQKHNSTKSLLYKSNLRKVIGTIQIKKKKNEDRLRNKG